MKPFTPPIDCANGRHRARGTLAAQTHDVSIAPPAVAAAASWYARGRRGSGSAPGQLG